MNLLIYLIAFLEGFTTLGVEIIAIRNFTPIVGSNSISTSVILGVILLALSYGYYIGGKIASKKKNIKEKLIRNLLIASVYYFFISFLMYRFIIESFLHFTNSYFISILFASLLLFAIPVFFASQTIPLLSELLKNQNTGEKMGKLLFYSTIGSFLGSVITSTVFFPLLGVRKSGFLLSLILVFCALIFHFGFVKKNKYNFLSFFLFVFFLYSIIYQGDFNNNIIFQKSNSYHDIKIYDNEYDQRIMLMSGGYSSGIDTFSKKSFFSYIKEAEKQVLELKPKNILLIGAAGFTFPNDIADYDFIENIDVIDIDKSLKDISEKYFLEKELSSKINFFPEPSRYFINKVDEKKYDMILVDAYTGKSLPPQILTYEFFSKLNNIGKNIYLNIIMDKSLNSDFSKNFFSTLNKSFKDVYYKDVNISNLSLTNFIVTNKKNIGYKENNYIGDKIYRDDKNSIELDLFKINMYK